MITKHLLFALALIFFVGCATRGGMTEWDLKAQQSGMFLHCSEMIEDKCITHQYFNSVQNTYQRFHYESSINGTDSNNN